MKVSHELLAEIREVFVKMEQGKAIHADDRRDLADRIRSQLSEDEDESIVMSKFRKGRYANLHDDIKAMREIEEEYRE